MVNPGSPQTFNELIEYTRTHARLIERHDREIQLIGEALAGLYEGLKTDFEYIRLLLLQEQADNYQAAHKYTNKEINKRLAYLEAQVAYYKDKIIETTNKKKSMLSE